MSAVAVLLASRCLAAWAQAGLLEGPSAATPAAFLVWGVSRKFDWQSPPNNARDRVIPLVFLLIFPLCIILTICTLIKKSYNHIFEIIEHVVLDGY
jgi:hypothetical protein